MEIAALVRNNLGPNLSSSELPVMELRKSGGNCMVEEPSVPGTLCTAALAGTWRLALGCRSNLRIGWLGQGRQRLVSVLEWGTKQLKGKVDERWMARATIVKTGLVLVA